MSNHIWARLFILMLGAVFCFGSPAVAKNWYVSDFAEFQAAMSSYNGGDTIVFTDDIDDVTSVVSSLGTKVTVDAQWHNYAYTTGNSGKALVAQTIVMQNWGSSTTPISGFYDPTSGSIISSGTLTILGSYFSNNGYDGSSITAGGGVIYSTGDNILNIAGTTFSGNKVKNNGGVIFSASNQGNISISNSVFDGNSAVSSSGTAYGGVLRVRKQDSSGNIIRDGSPILVHIEGTVFSNNISNGGSSAQAYGGAISTAGNVDIIIEDSRFENNQVITRSSNATGGALTIGGEGTIINTDFINNQAITTGSTGRGGAISYNGKVLKIIANRGNVNFSGNFATGNRGNDIYIYNAESGATGTTYLNALQGNAITFGSGIYGAGARKIWVNSANTNETTPKPLTYSDAAGNTVIAPTTGTVNLNAMVENISFTLWGGTMVINSEGGTTPTFTNTNINLKGGVLATENGVIDSVSLQEFTSVVGASLAIDANLSTGTSDNFTVTTSDTAKQAATRASTLTIDSINILVDGSTPSITIFNNELAPTLSGTVVYNSTYTNLYKYDFTPSSTPGVLDINQNEITSNTGLYSAVIDSNLGRTFSMTANETQNQGLGDMAGASGALLNIYGNGYQILGDGFAGINIGAGQSVFIEGVTEYNNFSNSAFDNAGSLSVYSALFSENNSPLVNGGAINNSGTVLSEDTDYTDNSAINGGAIYNTGTFNLNSPTTISNNVATTGNGGAIYNAGLLNINSALGPITFSGNTANGNPNDIYNESTGTIHIFGTNNVSMAGGISGTGIINKDGLGTLTVTGDLDGYTGAYNHSLGTTTTIGTFFGGATTLSTGTININGTIPATSTIALGTSAVVNLGSSSDVTLGTNAISSIATGTGSVNKTGTGDLAITGDLSGFSGIYIQTGGSTTVTGKMSNSLNTITNGTLNIGTGATFATNTVVNLGAGTVLNFTGTSDLTLADNSVIGSGSINKTGTGTITVGDVFTNFTGALTQTAGTTIVGLDNQIVGHGLININGGTLATNGGALSQGINVGSTSSSQGTWHHYSNADSAVSISSTNLAFTGTGGTAVFDKYASLSGDAQYTLAENIQNANSNTVAFQNSEVALGATNYTGNTTYSFTDSLLSLTNDALGNYSFSVLNLSSASLSLDISISSANAMTSDTLSTTSSTGGNFSLADIKVLADASTDSITSVSVTALTGVNFVTDTDVMTLTTAAHTYQVSTSGGVLTLTRSGVASTLNDMTTATGTRSYNFSTPATTTPTANLGNMGTGTFIAQGATTTASDSVLDGDDTYSFFNIPASTNVTFTLKDLTVQDANTSGSGSVLNLADSGSSALLQNVALASNDATGNGGAIAHTAGTLNIIGSTLTGNTSAAGGGAMYTSATATLGKDNFTGNQAAQGGALYVDTTGNVTIQGTSSFTNNKATTANRGGAIYNAGTLTLDSSEGNITFSGNTAGPAGSAVANDIYSNGGTINIKGSGNTTTVNVISGTGAINKSEASTLVVAGDSSGFTGTFNQTLGTTTVTGDFFGGANTLSGGTLNWQTTSSDTYNLTANSGTVNLASGSVLNLNSAASIGTSAALNILAGSTLNNAGAVSLNIGDTWAGALNNTGALVIDGSSYISNNNYVQTGSSSSLTVKNGGALTLANTTSSTINAGGINVGDGVSTGSTISVNANSIIGTGAVLDINTGNTLMVSGGTVNVNSGDTWAGTVNLSSGTLNYSGLASNGILEAYDGTLNITSGILNIGTGSSVSGEVSTNISVGTTLNVSGGIMEIVETDTWGGNVNLSSGRMVLSNFHTANIGALNQTGGTLVLTNASDVSLNSAVLSSSSGAVQVSGASNLAVGPSASAFTPSSLAIDTGSRFQLLAGRTISLNSLAVDNGYVDTVNGVIEANTATTLTAGMNTANFSIDIDGTTSDTWTLTSITTDDPQGIINIYNFNLLSAPPSDSIPLTIFTAANIDSDVVFTSTATDITTQFGTYSLVSDGFGVYTLKLNAIKQEYFRGQIASLEIFDTQMLSNRFLYSRYLNGTAAAGGFEKGRSGGDGSDTKGALWVLSFGIEHNAEFEQNLEVKTKTYGFLAGADFARVKLGSGWSLYTSAYAGYSDSTQDYDFGKNDISLGQAGFLLNVQNDRWKFIANTYAGFYNNKMNFYGNKDEYNNWFFGTGATAAYAYPLSANFTVQPSVSLNYMRLAASNWNGVPGGVSMRANTLNGLNSLAGLGFIYDDKSWKVYTDFQYGHNFMNDFQGKVGDIELPDIIKQRDYFDITLGITKYWQDFLSLNLQGSYRAADQNSLSYMLDMRIAF